MCANPTGSHPDAPRAGGETPDTIEICGHRFTRNVAFTAEYPNQRWLRLAADGNYRYAGADEWLDRICALQREVAELRASLLERHRDGERLDWLERAVPSREFRDFCNGLSTPWPGTFREFVDAAMSAPPSPERASK